MKGYGSPESYDIESVIRAADGFALIKPCIHSAQSTRSIPHPLNSRLRRGHKFEKRFVPFALAWGLVHPSLKALYHLQGILENGMVRPSLTFLLKF
jgi:hypothetical protein